MNGGPTGSRGAHRQPLRPGGGREGAAKEALAAHQRAYLANVLKDLHAGIRRREDDLSHRRHAHAADSESTAMRTGHAPRRAAGGARVRRRLMLRCVAPSMEDVAAMAEELRAKKLEREGEETEKRE